MSVYLQFRGHNIMLLNRILNEEDFSIAYYSLNHHVSEKLFDWRKQFLQEDDCFILQEILILPDGSAINPEDLSPYRVVPHRCLAPLILIGHHDSSAQYLSVVAKAIKGRSEVIKSDRAMHLVSKGINVLYSAPLFADRKEKDPFVDAFFRMGAVLNGVGMKESALTRTWLFLNDILADYEKLNQARQEYFNTWYPISRAFLPASTGIQSRINNHEMLAFAFCAFSGQKVAIRQLSSPLQNEPTDYGKLFSRAAVVEFPRSNILFVSGTASIDKTGRSVYVGSFHDQMEFTLDVLSAVLKQGKSGFADVAQAIVYLKRDKDMANCLRILDRRNFPIDRAVFQMGVDVCRDDLLCEIEVTAVINETGIACSSESVEHAS